MAPRMLRNVVTCPQRRNREVNAGDQLTFSFPHNLKSQPVGTHSQWELPCSNSPNVDNPLQESPKLVSRVILYLSITINQHNKNKFCTVLREETGTSSTKLLKHHLRPWIKPYQKPIQNTSVTWTGAFHFYHKAHLDGFPLFAEADLMVRRCITEDQQLCDSAAVMQLVLPIRVHPQSTFLVWKLTDEGIEEPCVFSSPSLPM